MIILYILAFFGVVWWATAIGIGLMMWRCEVRPATRDTSAVEDAIEEASIMLSLSEWRDQERR